MCTADKVLIGNADVIEKLAGELKPGDILVSNDGEPIAIKSVMDYGDKVLILPSRGNGVLVPVSTPFRIQRAV